MADATSSGGSGHSERSHKKTHHRTCSGSKPRITDNDSSWDLPSPSSEERMLGEAVEYLNGDREVARQAVAIVLGATARKRGLTGAISICTEVSKLLQINRRQNVGGAESQCASNQTLAMSTPPPNVLEFDWSNQLKPITKLSKEGTNLKQRRNQILNLAAIETREKF